MVRPVSITVRAVSLQVRNDPLAAQPLPSYGDYWIRTWDTEADLCLQYKCPGHVFDPLEPQVQINHVATLVQVHFMGSRCTIR